MKKSNEITRLYQIKNEPNKVEQLNIQLINHNLKQKEYQTLVTNLLQKTNLVELELNLSNRKNQYEGINLLFESFPKMNSLRKLNIKFNIKEDSHFTSFCLGLSQIPNLQELIIPFLIRFPRDDLDNQLSQSISQMTNLTHLVINCYNLYTQESITVYDFLLKLTNLKHLQLIRPYPNAIVALSNSFDKLINLQSLSLTETTFSQYKQFLLIAENIQKLILLQKLTFYIIFVHMQELQSLNLQKMNSLFELNLVLSCYLSQESEYFEFVKQLISLKNIISFKFVITFENMNHQDLYDIFIPQMIKQFKMEKYKKQDMRYLQRHHFIKRMKRLVILK